MPNTSKINSCHYPHKFTTLIAVLYKILLHVTLYVTHCISLLVATLNHNFLHGWNFLSLWCYILSDLWPYDLVCTLQINCHISYTIEKEETPSKVPMWVLKFESHFLFLFLRNRNVEFFFPKIFLCCNCFILLCLSCIVKKKGFICTLNIMAILHYDFVNTYRWSCILFYFIC